MPIEWTSIITKALDQAKVFVPAAGLTGLVVLFGPASWGLVSDKGDVHWLPAGTLFCLIATALMALYAYLPDVTENISNKRYLRRTHKRAVSNLNALSQTQKGYLLYIKDKEAQKFQAWADDETIIALTSMGILEQHEHTESYYALYAVPSVVWANLPEPTDHQRKLIRKQFEETPPWDPSRHSTRI